ncbi:isoprenoid biosynthesis glyoxalase ElbB [Geobacter pelophilus]|uniref:Isoprenoid biosynthesis glyoxalase ElbB n=1 Tax=Geoanaerobacter pelophilus TaxID=60036 RepID=A0AAW4L106_9BACT|nr:isoprenoid biosynthesis glyoxalase ElbB [Geoanaerobacter pelophilus]MBT0663842.1 isoprenoid biosynthesis glyoxalase ElbB [Geoanaerobacter pelophilus]
MKKRIGVVLSGCGVFDGSEIHEAVCTLLAINRNGAESICMAPDMELSEVNHLTGNETGAKRNVLVESARIARGKIKNIAEVKAADLDAVIFPGGFGAAKNLCTFAFKGPEATIQADVARLLKEMVAAKKPIGAICIAPALIAATLGKEYAPKVTIGNDSGTASAINQTGSSHVDCPVTEFVVDRENKIVSTPAYMLASNIAEAADGIEKAVKAVIDLI